MNFNTRLEYLRMGPLCSTFFILPNLKKLSQISVDIIFAYFMFLLKSWDSWQ
jgi:hypothetical protein